MTNTDRWDAEEWDRWCALTEAEQEAEVAEAERQYSDWYDGLTAAARWDYHRRSALQSCLSNRRCVKLLPGIDIFREHLRDAQKRLLALRLERQFGHTPGNA